jgi:hypothetical protein
MSQFNPVIGSLSTPQGDATIHVGRYPSGGAIAVEIVLDPTSRDGWTFSTNLAPYGAQFADDEFAVKTWSENEPVLEPMRATHLFEDTGRRIPTGFVVAQVWRIRDPKHVPPVRRRSVLSMID